MADDREQDMLDLMSEFNQLIAQLQQTVNEIWAEWTRTHGLKGIPGKGVKTDAPTTRVVKRVLR